MMLGVPLMSRSYVIAITAGWRATFLVIALWKQRPSLATSAVRKATFLVIALRVPVVVVEDGAGADSPPLLAKNATVAVKSATLLVPAPRLLEATPATEEATAVEAMAAEAMAGQVVEARLGIYPSDSIDLEVADWHFHSYTCGGVGHLSRDCVQGSKCYNCSGIGHISRDCPQPQKRACYTCGSEDELTSMTLQVTSPVIAQLLQKVFE
ncbi:hypothetical protein BU15DRAFT_60539 [Melanogaster broomeanus]|nr:hypothetical protein BU15DRAFT_60539 [Melanogaster broomeanus]